MVVCRLTPRFVCGLRVGFALYAAGIICLQDHASLCMRPACSLCRITLRSVCGCCNRRRLVRRALAGGGGKRRSCLGSVCGHVPDQHPQSWVAWVAAHRIGWLGSTLGSASGCSAGTRVWLSGTPHRNPNRSDWGRQASSYRMVAFGSVSAFGQIMARFIDSLNLSDQQILRFTESANLGSADSVTSCI
jgi:hypothetical protein